MRSFSLIVGAAAGLLAMFSCSGPEATDKTVGAYTLRLMSDTTLTEYQIISYSRNRNLIGNISVIGEPEATLLLADYLKKCDRYDNVNGKTSSDGLPDFSGETICPILDRYNSPYDDFVKKDREDLLAEINVRNLVTALDTACYLNAFDTEKIVHKSSAKLLVLSSLFSSEYGYSDIDTLLTQTNSKVKIISPVHTLLDEAWRTCGKGMQLGIWTDSTIIKKDIYGHIFADEKIDRDDPNAAFFAIEPDSAATTTERFLDFMKKYSSEENRPRLSALIVDDMTVDVEELEEAVRSVMAVDQDRYLTYLNYLSANFTIIDLRSAVAKACYKYLRESNSFTHRIAYPNVKYYVTTASERDTSFVTVELKDKYLTDDLREMMMLINIPNHVADYVR